MRIFLITLLLGMLTQTAFAHCPIDLGKKGNLCAQITWVSHPKLNIKPTDKFYSEADILIFVKGDKSHTPVVIKDIEIYPFMKMEGMTSHGTRYDLSVKSDGHYKLSKMRFIHSSTDWYIRFADVVAGSFDVNVYFAEVPVNFDLATGTSGGNGTSSANSAISSGSPHTDHVH